MFHLHIQGHVSLPLTPMIPATQDKVGSLIGSIELKLQDRIAGVNNLAESILKTSAVKTRRMPDCSELQCTAYDQQAILDKFYGIKNVNPTCEIDGYGLNYDNFYKNYVNQEMTCRTGQCKYPDNIDFWSEYINCDTDSVMGEPFLKKCKENTATREEGGAWQYFGADTGLFTVYPAHEQSEADSEGYDPRFRPWYVNALVQKPLDVVIILDSSGSMRLYDRMNLAKDAAKIMVNMLRPTDRVAVGEFDSSAAFSNSEIPCQNNKLSLATKLNKIYLNKWISSIEPMGGTQYSTGIDIVKQYFVNTYTADAANEESSFEPRIPVFVFLTDGKNSDSESTIMQAMKDLVVSVPNVIPMIFGLDNEYEVLKDMAFHRFENQQVSPPANADSLIQGQYTKLSSSGNLKVTLSS